MAGGGGYERTLEETPTWAVAVVCFVLLGVSILIEHALHLIGHWLQKKNKRALYEALEKIKAELMLLGFISLLLTVLQGPISDICISQKVGATWHPCDKKKSTKEPYGKCEDKGQVPLVSSYGIHQLHIFIFVLAVFHVLYCIITWFLGRIKMRKWRAWEDETKTIEYQYSHDPERFRFARDTSFGRRHLTFWSGSPILLWIMCFGRQFYKSVDKVDYLTLRHGFIMAHLAPSTETKFDFQKYIKKSLEEDFKVVVGISPPIWMFAVLFLLTNTHGWFSYLWLPFIPLLVLLLVGAKLQVIITKMGLRIQDRGDVVKGAPVVEPGDDLFWFGRPRLILFLINFVLFQNAFQLAFFAWSTYEFGLQSCYHKRIEDIIIRITMGVLIEFLCGYVTLPLYALVTQMGTTMKPTIFNDRVATALKNWHRTARKQTKHGGKSGSTTPFTSRPGTPSHGMSPVHLLQNYRQMDSSHTSPRHSNFDNDHWDNEDFARHRNHDGIIDQLHNQEQQIANDQENAIVPVPVEQGSTSASMGQLSVPIVPPRPIRTQHEINMSMSDFSFEKRG